jgi:hypothetical protein
MEYLGRNRQTTAKCAATLPSTHMEQVRSCWFSFPFCFFVAGCGFQVEALYADSDKCPYGSNYPGELVFVARKV